MSDLISREDAIRELYRSSVYKWSVEEDKLAHIWAISIIESLPSAETHDKRTETHGVCLDLIRREDAIAYIDRVTNSGLGRKKSLEYIRKYIVALPSADAEWIPCNKQMPDELEAVNITWVNHNPPPYYKYTKDVPLVDTAVYYKGAWYWWDETVIDLLGEYDGAYIHGIEPIDKDIEITAWMPLPTPYKGGDDE